MPRVCLLFERTRHDEIDDNGNGNGSGRVSDEAPSRLSVVWIRIDYI